ncbi:MAG: methyltransferase domain-containing protein [Anaerolineae bacterium]|nr:methyltransferase domain-containing protein [Anaerolineae bacterium]
MINSDSAYAEQELLYNRFMEPALRSAINHLALPPGSIGLDAGCGPGGLLHLLDAASGGVGYTFGTDISSPLLVIAEREIQSHNIEDRVGLFCASLGQPLPLPDDCLDWVWSADVLTSEGAKRGFPEPAEVVKEMARVVKPGGQVALFLGNRLGAVFIPGHAHIENVLATAVNLNYRKQDHFHPAFHNENVLSWMRAAGLTQLRMSAHITEYQHPLHPDVIQYIQKYIFEEEYCPLPELKQYAHGIGLSESEWQTWLDISNPQSSNYILTQEDYYCVRFGTLATGRVLK